MKIERVEKKALEFLYKRLCHEDPVTHRIHCPEGEPETRGIRKQDRKWVVKAETRKSICIVEIDDVTEDIIGFECEPKSVATVGAPTSP